MLGISSILNTVLKSNLFNLKGLKVSSPNKKLCFSIELKFVKVLFIVFEISKESKFKVLAAFNALLKST